jgi:hypothetical protein
MSFPSDDIKGYFALPVFNKQVRKRLNHLTSAFSVFAAGLICGADNIKTATSFTAWTSELRIIKGRFNVLFLRLEP